MYYVYVLKNPEGQFYIGQTGDLESRVKRHNQGRCKYTKNRGPWELVCYEEYSTRSDACKRETELKRKKSKSEIIKLINSSTCSWLVLAGFLWIIHDRHTGYKVKL